MSYSLRCSSTAIPGSVVSILFALVLSTSPALGEFVEVDNIEGFREPTRIALSAEGHMIVSDYGRGEVVIFDAQGVKIATLNQFGKPLGVAVGMLPADTTPIAVMPTRPVECDDEEPAGEQGDKQDGKDKKEKKVKKIKRLKKHRTSQVDVGSDPVEEDDSSSCDGQPPEPLPLQLPVIYVADEADGSVRILKSGVSKMLGSGAGEFVKPNGVAVTSAQDIYVIDSGTHQVKRYNNLGVWQASFGSEGEADGQIRFPIDIAVNETLNELYVTDFWNSRLVVFDLAGNWVRNIVAPLNDNGDSAFFRPSGLGVGPDGTLYVVDNALSCVVILNPQGGLIDIIGYGNGQYWTGDLALPLDAAADGSRVYVTSSQNHSVQVFAPPQ